MTEPRGGGSTPPALPDPVSSSPPVAIVLAAGLGARLRAVQAERPKGFVEIGGEPLVARSVAALRDAGIRDFVFVVGWRAEFYRDWLAAALPGARCVPNADYAATGSLRSLRLGAAAAPGRDVLVVESDLLYEAGAPARLLAEPPGDVLLTSGFTRSGDEVWVYAEPAGRLRRLDKQAWEGRTPAGELVGLTRLTAATMARLAAAAAALPAAAHYEDGLNAICAEIPVRLRHEPGLVWCEIDDPAHLERARREIWPRLQAAAKNPVP